MGPRLPHCLLGNDGTKGWKVVGTHPCSSLGVIDSPQMVAAGQARRDQGFNLNSASAPESAVVLDWVTGR